MNKLRKFKIGSFLLSFLCLIQYAFTIFFSSLSVLNKSWLFHCNPTFAVYIAPPRFLGTILRFSRLFVWLHFSLYFQMSPISRHFHNQFVILLIFGFFIAFIFHFGISDYIVDYFLLFISCNRSRSFPTFHFDRKPKSILKKLVSLHAETEW